MTPGYIYAARCLRVVDGDTIDALVDLGFHLTATLRFRLYGIDTPELTSKDLGQRTAAAAAKSFVNDRLTPHASGFPLRIETYKDPDSFGRWLAVIRYPGVDGVMINLCDELIVNGLATPFRR